MDPKLPAYEKLGAFYLGRPVDPDSGDTLPVPLLYDSRDLLTHAVCVGMTGSGKTGLCVGLLEEAAIDGIPSLVIDPKGDLSNLAFNFPELRSEDFEPWVDRGEAERKGLSTSEFAAQQAELWRTGLAEWDQGKDRLRRLKEAADVAIYTPGSESGLPISILESLNPPSQQIVDDADLFGDRVLTVASTLLGLLGLEADPVRSREHILLSAILAERWKSRRGLDLEALIQMIQNPPFDKLGVMELESFFPSRDRFELAIAMNNLMASPAMQKWLIGPPLDIDRLLYTESGKPRIAILSIAHLSDNERMSFVALVLNEVVGWVRTRSGTTSLRAIVYMDEVFGYLPPVAEPPSKKPLLTLFKQARAYGVGVVLATQNPADLDYKALSNAGTWFLGRLQTERDKLRVMEGLEGVKTADTSLSRSDMEKLLAGLGKRTFLLHNVHEEAPVLFRTRWAMSYLRGPLTRKQIKILMDPKRDEVGEPRTSEAGRAPAPDRAALSSRPLLPPEIPQAYLADRGRGTLTYEPSLLGLAKVHFVDSRRGIQHAEELALRLPLVDDEIDWYEAEELAAGSFDPDRDLEDEPADDATGWGDLPDGATSARKLKSWEKKLADYLYRSRRVEIYQSPTYKESSQPGESERDFRIRLADEARERRDAEKAKLEKKYATKLRRIEERRRKAEQRVDREREQAKTQKMQTLISFGATALSALMGRKAMSRTSMGRATTAMRGVSRSFKEGQDVDRAREDVATLTAELAELNRELEDEIDELEERFDPQTEELETVQLKPRRTDIEVRKLLLAWAPLRDGRPSWG